jgi:hypothetical protein
LGFDPILLDLPYPLALGYVTFGDGDGHQGSDTGFTKTDEALRNWASDAHKKTCGVGMMIIMPAYGGTVNLTHLLALPGV